MPALLSASKRLFLHSLLIAFPVFVSGQGLIPAGAEYGLTVPFSGDQNLPRLALGPNGSGWVVWQDSIIDGRGNGFGIGAGRINGSSSVGTRFRVTQNPLYDQVNPDLALMNNGNVWFFWQGGALASRSIYGRFMSASGTFLTGDLLLTPKSAAVTNRWTTNVWGWGTNRYCLRTFPMASVVFGTRQGSRDPAVANLTNGTAVLVYSGTRSYASNFTDVKTTVTYPYPYYRALTNSITYWRTNRADDMEEIFFQRFAANGTRLATEKLVNEISSFNQRNPAVAALPNGNFVVVWVSEQHFAVPPLGYFLAPTNDENQVVISGRIYNSAGLPVTGEFRVDGVGPAVCALPAVSAAGDGFLVAWTQKDMQTRTNGWDVYGRMFTGAGSPSGTSFRINAYTAGAQGGPKIASLGNDQMVVWSSMGQDGSMEGVYGRWISEGVLAGPEFRVNTTTRNKQIQPLVVPLDANQFLAVWSQYAQLATGFDLMAQRYGLLTPLAAPQAPAVAAVDQARLLVSWPQNSDPRLQHYSLYMDDTASPQIVSGTSWAATGLEPGSTHSFRLGYTLNNGLCSRLSPPGIGTTLSIGETNTTSEVVNPTNNPVVVVTNTSGVLNLSLGFSGAKAAVQWNSEAGAMYQLQASTNLISWVNVGAPRSGSGSVVTQNCEAQNRASFYRVVRIQ